MKRWLVFLLLSTLAAASFGVAAGAQEPRTSRLRVLFIGNSYTRFNDLPSMVRRLASSDPEGPRLRTSYEAHPGFSLRRHWEHRALRRRITNGHFDVVVLQERSLHPIEAPDETFEYAQRLHDHAVAAGARVVFFETWARHPGSRVYRETSIEDPDDMLARVDALYQELGHRLDSPVAPVGRAWLRALNTIPEARLHLDDGTHPAVAGTYLSASVLYGTLSGRDPRVAEWYPYPLRSARALAIRAVASAVLEPASEPRPEPPQAEDDAIQPHLVERLADQLDDPATHASLDRARPPE